MIPADLRAAVGAALAPVVRARSVGGGSVNHAWRVETERGPAFLKASADAPPGHFAAEARGLRALASASTDAMDRLRVPRPLAHGDLGDGGGAGAGDEAVHGWLLTEWLEPAPRGADFGERLGRALAALHRAGGGEGGWGWEEDGWIGPLPQPNDASADWAEFWRDRRLEPQLRLARDAGRMPGRAADWEALFARLPELLAAAEEDGPSLVHGDLWSGNVLCVEPGAGATSGEGAGEPAVVDPAAYRGHREVDLAMADLFGGFDDAFRAAYREAWPVAPGYANARRPVYQLYFLLVHVVLFGGGYAARTEAALRAALAA